MTCHIRTTNMCACFDKTHHTGFFFGKQDKHLVYKLTTNIYTDFGHYTFQCFKEAVQMILYIY